MPRVACQPSGKGGRTTDKQTLATPHKPSPMKIPLNDDRTEKAARLQSRQALQDMQMNQIKAAASPMRKMNGSRAGSSSPRTPARSRGSNNNKENDDPQGTSSPLNLLSHSAVTPMKRVPILANFEEWMKMATDNKINAANSWNFALIDYFHDMSLLKEGDGVNFQKASCTLDGCVKIYTSRVDSVASETGKLLSGLADSGGGKKGKGRGEEEGEGDGEGEDGSGDEEEGGRKKGKKKTQRPHEQTLAPSFASLQLKKLELEFAVDPLFKKASADFDEGGAKGLLLNHLSIDSEGRIVFDSSDDAADVQSYPNATQMQQTLVDPTATVPEDPSNQSLLAVGQTDNQEIDLASLASKFFPDLSILDSQDICPSMKSFTIGDPTSDLNLSFLKAPDNWRETHKTPEPDKPLIDAPIGDKSGIFLDSENAAGFDDDDDSPLGGFDMDADVGFGEGGEAWAKDAALEPMLRVARADDLSTDREGTTDGGMVGDFDPANPGADAYTVGLNHHHYNDNGSSDPTDNILSYFDAAFRSTKTAAWAGPEHWRIRRIKAAQSASSENSAPVPRTRKEKEPFEIDFLAPIDTALAEMLYTPAASNAAISLPKAQWKTKGRNLLPDDRHFNSRDLVRLWLKPKARVGKRQGKARDGRVGGQGDGEREALPLQGEMDEAYWARKREEEDQKRREEEEEEKERKEGDYDADFFNDDDDALPFGGGLPDDVGDDDDDDAAVPFTDAREMLSPGPGMENANILPQALEQQTLEPGGGGGFAAGSFGSQLVTQNGGLGGNRRLRPEYVNYARVAKKVDVRRLKENMWKGMSQRLMGSFAADRNGADAAPPTPTAPTTDGNRDGDADMMDVDSDPLPPPSKEREEDGRGGELKFTSLIRDLRHVYPEAQMRDISTSYCFICLLHLANEKGLVLESGADAREGRPVIEGGLLGEGEGRGGGGGNEGARLREIRVRRDESVGIGYVGE